MPFKDDDFRHLALILKRKQMRCWINTCKKQTHFPKIIRAMKYSKNEKRVVNAKMLLENKVPLVNKQQQQQAVAATSATGNNDDCDNDDDADDGSSNSSDNTPNNSPNIRADVCVVCRNLLSPLDNLCSTCMKVRFCKNRQNSSPQTPPATSSLSSSHRQIVVRVGKRYYNDISVSKLRRGEHLKRSHNYNSNNTSSSSSSHRSNAAITTPTNITDIANAQPNQCELMSGKGVTYWPAFYGRIGNMFSSIQQESARHDDCDEHRCSSSIQSSSSLASILKYKTSLTPVPETATKSRLTWWFVALHKLDSVGSVPAPPAAETPASQENSTSLLSRQQKRRRRQLHQQQHHQLQQQQKNLVAKNNSYCSPHSNNDSLTTHCNRGCIGDDYDDDDDANDDTNHADDHNAAIMVRVQKFTGLMHAALKMYHLLILCVQIAVLNNEQNNKCTFNKRQQCPPSSRLTLNYNNSYNKHKLNTYLHQPNTIPNTIFSTEQYYYNMRYQNNNNNNNNKNSNINNKNNHNNNKHNNQQRKASRWLPPYFKETPTRAHKHSRIHTNHRDQSLVSFGIIIITILPLLLLRSASAQGTALLTAAAASPDNTVTLARTEKVCKSLDLRNSPMEFSALENCTVIEGFLLITVVNTVARPAVEFNRSYPLLTEVTEYVVVYRVQNLQSLAQIFPNLSIIRGHRLFEGYALVVYSNPQLEELGLTKLSNVMKGGVRIENNEKLCFVDTINWKAIVRSADDNFINDNRQVQACPTCGDCQHCWNIKMCQKVCPAECPDNCANATTCCNESCVGGCSPNNLNECNSCRNYSMYNNTCVKNCPPNFYNYLNRRCVTAEGCRAIGSKFENNKEEKLIPHNGECSTNCPVTYNKVDNQCVFCGDSCTRKCVGGLVDSVQSARSFHACTHIIKKGIVISIKRGGRHLMADLEYGFSAVEQIDTFLKVHRTYGIYSLDFFKKLKTISGTIQCEKNFSLYILENNDLETLWKANQSVHIAKGRVFFHFNPKLCLEQIERLREDMAENKEFDRNEVATDSNGSKGACNTQTLNVMALKTSSYSATISILNPLKFDDDRTFIGYQLFYMKDEFGNATKHSSRPCDDSWNFAEPTKTPTVFIGGLVPYTKYAYYVKTMTIASESNNANSGIEYFTTKSSKPQKVAKLFTTINSSTEMTISWLPPVRVFGKLIKYKVSAHLERVNFNLATKDYCSDQSSPDTKNTTRKTTVPEVATPRNQEECDCRNTYKVNEDDLDAKIHEGMNFENLLQDFVYVKQNTTAKDRSSAAMIQDGMASGKQHRRSVDTNEVGNFDSFLVRHMRALPHEPANSGNISKAGIAAITTTNKTVLDPTGVYYEKFITTVDANVTEFVFTKLKHFTVYDLSVSACRAPEEGADAYECSDSVTVSERTLKLDYVDMVRNVQHELETTNTSRTSIRLRWEPPERPNGEVISYIIYYQLQVPDAVVEKKCILSQDFNNMTQGYALTSLSSGNYSVRVLVKSLAGMGPSPRAIFVYIPPSELSPTAIGFIIAAAIVMVFLLTFAIMYCVRKKAGPPSDLKMFPTVNPYYISLQYIPDEWEVERERVIQLSSLGQGSFGMVYEGIMKGLNSTTEDMPCAIKTVNENATDRERMNFLKEASVMKQFDTFHVVRLLGVCSVGQPALVIMELMKNGDLKSYLRKHRPDESDDDGINLVIQPPPISRIYQMAIEIADGMAYLAAKKFVHRDLAARNCMVACDLTVKIGDFGMTRDIYETDYYRKGTKGLLPVRWMPPESLRDGIYSTASDVFSYGVVLWEMATLASQPYQGLTNDQVLRYVIDGGIMERPENCPDKLYRLMQRCWHHRPSARPSFMEIIRLLVDLANSFFRDVSFYHSDEGQMLLNKEINDPAGNMPHSEDVFIDHNHDIDDVTTPLRVGEYKEYNMNMGNNSSVEENPAEVDIVDDQAHSQYSLELANTPDDLSKASFAQDFQNNPALLSYMQFNQTPSQLSSLALQHLNYISTGAGDDLDDLGQTGHDDEDGASSTVGGEQSLLPRHKKRLVPTIMPQLMPMSSSVPDPLSSYLHPSTASAASSNASSTTTNSAAGGGRPLGTSLKRTVAERMQNVSHSLLPSRLRIMNRLLPHRRTNSNASQNEGSSGATASAAASQHPPTTMSDSSAAAGKGLVTIESGESGSDGVSSSAQPKFYTAIMPPTAGSGKPNAAGEVDTATATGTTGSSTPKIKSKPLSAMLSSSSNPNYHILDESLNASATSTQLGGGGGGGDARLKTSSNPNYELMQAPAAAAAATAGDSAGVNYVLMTSPQDAAGMRVSENPNYQPTAKIIAPRYHFSSKAAPSPFASPRASLSDNEADTNAGKGDFHHDIEDQTRPLSKERSAGSISSAGRDERAAAGKQQQQQQRRSSGSNRSRRSRSRRARSDNNDSTSEKSMLMAAESAGAKPSSATFSIKEKWLQQQQQQQPPPPPPPNGMIGRDT